MNISHYGFVCPVNFSNEKYIRVTKKKLLDIFLRQKLISGIRELFANTSYLTKISKFWNSQPIPIPIRTEVGSSNLFLFLVAGKITIH